jgi:hypothetical protein
VRRKVRMVQHMPDLGAAPDRLGVITHTAGSRLPEMREWPHDLCDIFDADVDHFLGQFTSHDPETWLTLVAEAPLWIQALGAAASVYITAILAEAGKETWKERAKYFPTLSGALKGLGDLASKVVDLKRRHPPRSTVTVSIPFPHAGMGTGLSLACDSKEMVAAEIALFVHYLPKVQALIRDEIEDKDVRISGGIQLKLLDDGSLEVEWLENAPGKPAGIRRKARIDVQ